MENRKDCAGPRDMLDDTLLRQILSDMNNDDLSRTGCGCGSRERDTDDRSGGRSCGCGSRERDTDDRSGGRSCGCGSRERDTDDRSGGRSCGCGSRERDTDDRSGGRSCGCGNSGVNSRRNNEERSGRNRERSNGCGCSRLGQSNTRQAEENSWQDTGCGCVSGPGMPRLEGFPLVMAYSPNQNWEGVYEPEEALARGTLFSGLHYAWYPSNCPDRKDCGCGRRTGGDNV